MTTELFYLALVTALTAPHLWALGLDGHLRALADRALEQLPHPEADLVRAEEGQLADDQVDALDALRTLSVRSIKDRLHYRVGALDIMHEATGPAPR